MLWAKSYEYLGIIILFYTMNKNRLIERTKMLVTVQVLHESGMDAEQIARKLERPVEFIIDLLP
ncbi:MAG: hypothetical protein D3904_01710 [Candidatus Electrothrix sp. EH2]|nr:hypothetical protein [Candidatus Electrothrix sp. EH2]